MQTKAERNEYLRKYAQTDKCKATRKAYQSSDRGRAVHDKSQLKTVYGITLEDYNILLIQQNNVCAGCNNLETSKHKNGNVKRLSVDHCHKSGKVRWLLCQSCNLILGHAKDDANLLIKLGTMLLTTGETVL